MKDTDFAGKKIADLVLDPKDAERVKKRYQERIAKYGVTMASLCVGDEEKQLVRHKTHSLALRTSNPAVLDIGCGLGDFHDYLLSNGIECAYSGYDIVPEYVEACRNRYSESEFSERNIFEDGIDGEHDTIVICQALNNRYLESDNTAVVKTAMAMTFERARVSVTVDMLSAYVDYEEPHLFYYSPEEMLRFAKSLTRRVVLHQDYRAFEFCIQLFHEDAPGYVP